MIQFNPPSYDTFYGIVDDCVALGRPCLVHGPRGVGKTHLLTALRPYWRCKPPLSPESVLYFTATPLDHPVSVFRGLIAEISEKSPASNRPFELRSHFERSLRSSKIKLIIIDDAEFAKPEFYHLIWTCLEKVRAQGHPIGLVVSYTGKAPIDPELFEFLPDVVSSIPIYGFFHIAPLTWMQTPQALVHWLPCFQTVVDGLKVSEKTSQLYVSAKKRAQLLQRLTSGLLLELSDLAHMWNKHVKDNQPSAENLKTVWSHRGKPFPEL